jgi:hypothetical protein
MYPYAMMPDPDAGLRLTKLGAKVNFRKGVFKKPVKVRGPQDWKDPETKDAKMVDHEIWLVTIELPLKYINRGLEQTDEIIQKDIQDTNAELADAFEDEMPAETGMEGDEMGGMGMEPTSEMQPPEEGL